MVPTVPNILAANAVLATACVACRLLFELPFPSRGKDGPPTPKRRLKGFRALVRAWTMYMVGLTGNHYLVFVVHPWVERRYGGIAAFPVWLLSAAFVIALLLWLNANERKQWDAE
jgi:hypothetical protein